MTSVSMGVIFLRIFLSDRIKIIKDFLVLYGNMSGNQNIVIHKLFIILTNCRSNLVLREIYSVDGNFCYFILVFCDIHDDIVFPRIHDFVVSTFVDNLIETRFVSSDEITRSIDEYITCECVIQSFFSDDIRMSIHHT